MRLQNIILLRPSAIRFQTFDLKCTSALISHPGFCRWTLLPNRSTPLLPYLCNKQMIITSESAQCLVFWLGLEINAEIIAGELVSLLG